MSRKEKYKVGDLILSVDDGSYLVEVEKNREAEATHNLQDLPAWIFESRYAIWLTSGSAPIRIRAMEGEQIKQQLLNRIAVR